MSMIPDTRRGDEFLTRSAFWNAPWPSLVRLARFMRVRHAEHETPHAKWSLVQTLYSQTRVRREA